jgi:hypothetical protein
MSTNPDSSRRMRRISSMILVCALVGSVLLFSPLPGNDTLILEAQAYQPAPVAVELPRPEHIVIVFEENKGYADIIGSPNAPYLNSLVKQGALLTGYYALHHPSQPNYLEFFSGNKQGICNDTCATSQFLAPSLGGNLIKKGLTFVGYAEDLAGPPHGSSWNSPCTNCYYALRHAPWIYFKDVPASSSLDFTNFPWTEDGFARLPTVAMVIPNLIHDMHSLPPSSTPSNPIPLQVANGDVWLQRNLGAYAEWAKNHNSLLIVTWDEDSSPYHYPANCSQVINTTPPANRIPAILVGSIVKNNSTSNQQYNHYDLLRSIEDMYGLPLIGGSQNAKDITDIWK